MLQLIRDARERSQLEQLLAHVFIFSLSSILCLALSRDEFITLVTTYVDQLGQDTLIFTQYVFNRCSQ